MAGRYVLAGWWLLPYGLRRVVEDKNFKLLFIATKVSLLELNLMMVSFLLLVHGVLFNNSFILYGIIALLRCCCLSANQSGEGEF